MSPLSRNLLLLVRYIHSDVSLHCLRGNESNVSNESDESDKSDNEYDENDNNDDSRKNYDGSGRSGRDRTLRVLFRNVSLNLSPGEILSLSSPSGCSKSRLLRILASLCPNYDRGGGEGGGGAAATATAGAEEEEEGTTTTEGIYPLGEESGGGGFSKRLQRQGGGLCSSRRYGDANVDASIWRREVRYVNQGGIGIPGTPAKFICRVALLESYRSSSRSQRCSSIQGRGWGGRRRHRRRRRRRRGG